MDTKRVLLIGCGAAAAIAVLLAAAAGIWVWHAAKDPEGVRVTIEAPDTVAVGEEFVMSVAVENLREDRPFNLTDVDVHDDYLKGFAVLGTEPPAKSNMHVPLDNSMSYSFDVSIAPKETQRFRFRLRPPAPGVFRGNVDVCEGSRFLTTGAQTAVGPGAPTGAEAGP